MAEDNRIDGNQPQEAEALGASSGGAGVPAEVAPLAPDIAPVIPKAEDDAGRIPVADDTIMEVVPQVVMEVPDNSLAEGIIDNEPAPIIPSPEALEIIKDNQDDIKRQDSNAPNVLEQAGLAMGATSSIFGGSGMSPIEGDMYNDAGGANDAGAMGVNLPAGAKNEEAPWGATFTAAGSTYAASIFWQPLQNPDNPLPEVRETAENVLDNADLYVVRPSGMPQYGLGISAEGHRAGMPVAALALVDAFSDVPSSVSVFKVPEGWWFIAIRNDLILSEEDMLYLNEEDAKQNFTSMMAVPDWGRKVAPIEWGIEGAEEMFIDDVFSKAPKIKLSKLKKEFNVKLTALFVGAVILVGWAAFALLSYLFGDSEIIREAIAPPPAVKPQAEAPKVTPLPMPWESVIVPSEFIKVCSDSTAQLVAATVPGWTISDISCQHNGLSTSWSMQWGRMSNFPVIMKKYNIEGLSYSLASGGRGATGTIPFNNLRKAASEPKLTAAELVNELTDISQAINLPITVSVSNIAPSATAPKDAPQMPSYSYVNFSFSSELPLSQWNQFFSNFDGLEIISLVYNTGSNNWKYEGRIYGKNN